jgi:hypothetical protein
MCWPQLHPAGLSEYFPRVLPCSERGQEKQERSHNCRKQRQSKGDPIRAFRILTPVLKKDRLRCGVVPEIDGSPIRREIFRRVPYPMMGRGPEDGFDSRPQPCANKSEFECRRGPYGVSINPFHGVLAASLIATTGHSIAGEMRPGRKSQNLRKQGLPAAVRSSIPGEATRSDANQKWRDHDMHVARPPTFIGRHDQQRYEPSGACRNK